MTGSYTPHPDKGVDQLERATEELRFIIRQGDDREVRILQQKFEVMSFIPETGDLGSVWNEWRDVPSVYEGEADT